MNRPGGAPQSLRGLPAGFNTQQQQPMPQARSVSSRLPNGKLGNNGGGWAFGSGVPLGAAVQNPARPQPMGGNISFAQSLGGSQPATPLDLSEFPSLSNTSQLANNGQSSLWSTGARTIAGQGLQRNANTPLSSQQAPGQQDDMFGSTSRLPSNNQSAGTFRFGSQAGVGQASSTTQASTADEFPPLNNRAPNAGDIGQDRSQSLLSSLGFGAQVSQVSQISQVSGAPAAAPAQAGNLRSAAANGLLSALSANSRAAADVRSPVGTRPQETRNLTGDDEARSKQSTYGEDGRPAQPSLAEIGSQSAIDPRSALGAIGADGTSKPAGVAEDDSNGASGAGIKDPLAGMAPIDKWGMKGLRTLITGHPGYSAAMSGFGLDLASLNVDLSSNDLLSTQVYSLFDGAAPRPAIPKFRLPDCYKVSNVGPIENKITGFNEETLMWIFYSCPNDVKQHMAAVELNNRNWRWHKRQQVWLTKDDLMMPQVLSQNHERGYYIIWDPANWRKERTTREITLNYADLDNTPLTASTTV